MVQAEPEVASPPFVVATWVEFLAQLVALQMIPKTSPDSGGLVALTDL